MKSNTQTIVCLVPERLPREGGHDDGSGVATEDRMSHPIRTPLVAILAVPAILFSLLAVAQSHRVDTR
jgi:hypothetical protein